MKKKFTQTGALLIFLSMLVLFVTYQSKSPAAEIVVLTDADLLVFKPGYQLDLLGDFSVSGGAVIEVENLNKVKSMLSFNETFDLREAAPIAEKFPTPKPQKLDPEPYQGKISSANVFANTFITEVPEHWLSTSKSMTIVNLPRLSSSKVMRLFNEEDLSEISLLAGEERDSVFVTLRDKYTGEEYKVSVITRDLFALEEFLDEIKEMDLQSQKPAK